MTKQELLKRYQDKFDKLCQDETSSEEQRIFYANLIAWQLRDIEEETAVHENQIGKSLAGFCFLKSSIDKTKPHDFISENSNKKYNNPFYQFIRNIVSECRK